jgi:hypothetical protein
MKKQYPYWRSWRMRVYDFLIRHFVECPCCNGEGGETEVITDDGRGPYYECGFCNGTGTVYNPIKRFRWWYWEHRFF